METVSNLFFNIETTFFLILWLLIIIIPGDEHLRKVVVWLEEQKIRHYKIDERKGLRDITSNDWPQVYQKYCDDLACPVKSPHLAQLEWLIYTAVKDEVNDLNGKKTREF